MAALQLISLQNVDCSFYVCKSRLVRRQVDVFNDCSFAIYAHATLGIVGHSGAYKSTLLQILRRIFLQGVPGKVLGAYTDLVKRFSAKMEGA